MCIGDSEYTSLLVGGSVSTTYEWHLVRVLDEEILSVSQVVYHDVRRVAFEAVGAGEPRADALLGAVDVVAGLAVRRSRVPLSSVAWLLYTSPTPPDS